MRLVQRGNGDFSKLSLRQRLKEAEAANVELASRLQQSTHALQAAMALLDSAKKRLRELDRAPGDVVAEREDSAEQT